MRRVVAFSPAACSLWRQGTGRGRESDRTDTVSAQLPGHTGGQRAAEHPARGVVCTRAQASSIGQASPAGGAFITEVPVTSARLVTGLAPAAPARSVVATAPLSLGRPSDAWAPSAASLHAANAAFPVVMALVAATSALAQLSHGWRAGQQPRVKRMVGPSPSAQPTSSAPLLILWDLENCSVPAATTPWSVASSILGSLRSCGYTGPVKELAAYGDFSLMRPATRRQLQATGWRCIDVPSGRKDAADRALQLDLLMYAREVPPPACVLLISGDRDFAPSMHRLSQLNYTTLLAAPVATASVAKELTSSASRVFDWASLACGLVVFEEKARTESRAEDISNKNSGEAATSGGGGASRWTARSRAQDVSAFVAAASEAIEAEDVDALQEVVSAAQAAGLRVTREQEALTELRKKLKRRELHVTQARSRLHDALAQGNAMLCEAALLNARAQGVAQFLQPEVDAATAVVKASRGDDDDEDDEDEEDDRRRQPRASGGRVASPGGDGGADDPLLVLSQLKSPAGEAAYPEWYRTVLILGATACDLGMLQYAQERATEEGLDASPASLLLAAVSRARSLAGALQKAALVRDQSTLAGLLGMRSSSTIMLNHLMPGEHAEGMAALETLRQQALEAGEGSVSRSRRKAEVWDRDELPPASADADALRERIAAAVDAEDGPALRAVLFEGALRLRIPAEEGDIRRLKVSMAARECISDLNRAAACAVHCPQLLRSRIVRAQRDYITRYPTRSFPKTNGALLAALQAALDSAQAVEALLPPDIADLPAAQAETHEEASALAR